MTTMETFSQNKLKTGDIAPDFTAKDEKGREVSLHNYKGKKVVLYFYPKDHTPGCTAQACNLRDNYEALLKAGYVILGVSADDALSHRDFIEKYTLPFTLLEDPDKIINRKYGVWVEKEKEGKKYWGTARTTFLISEDGVISHIIDKVETEQHAQQILDF
jgi:peroxiredoxin Q/BCP